MAPPVPTTTFPGAMALTAADFNGVSTTGNGGSPNKGYHFNEDTLKLIDAVKARPALWHRKHLRQRVQVAHRGWEEIRKLFKASDVKSLKVRWKTIRDSFRREVKRIEDGEISSSSWPLYQRMTFLIGHFRTTRYSNRDSLSPEESLVRDGHDSLSEEDLSAAAMMDSEGYPMGTEYEPFHGSGESMIADSDPEDLSAFEPLPVDDEVDNKLRAIAHEQELLNIPPHIYGEVTFKNKIRARTRAEPPAPPPPVVERKPEPKPESIGSVESDADYNFLMSLHPFMRKFSGKKNLSVRIQIQQLIADAMEKD